MVSLHFRARPAWSHVFFLAPALAAVLAGPGAAEAPRPRIAFLHIGKCESLVPANKTAKQKASKKTLYKFIKDETGLNSEITHEKDWQVLADKMARGDIQIGAFQGYEFAWAQARYPVLKPLALAVNGYRYPVACVVVRRDNRASDFAGLQGQSLALTVTTQGCLALFLDRQTHVAGKERDAYFSRTISCPNYEDALDDVYDEVTQAALVDQGALEAYRRRKPGRYRHLKVVARSQRFPPVVLAYYEGALDPATRRKFLNGLVAANRTEKGRMMMTLFKLTSFQTIPEGFDELLADVRKAYPVPGGKAE